MHADINKHILACLYKALQVYVHLCMPSQKRYEISPDGGHYPFKIVQEKNEKRGSNKDVTCRRGEDLF